MCMGPPLGTGLLRRYERVYPHVYGATSCAASAFQTGLGLSPCVWGHLLFPAKNTLNFGSIPMCMGPPARPTGGRDYMWVYPHVYGATGVKPNMSSKQEGLCSWRWGNDIRAELR